MSALAKKPDTILLYSTYCISYPTSTWSYVISCAKDMLILKVSGILEWSVFEGNKFCQKQNGWQPCT